MKKLALVAAAFLALSLPATAQFAEAQKGGPVSVGQVMAQVDPGSGKAVIVQAPAPAPVSGGVIQLSAFGWLQPYADTIVQALIVAFFGVIGKSKYSQWLDQSSRDAIEIFAKNRASSLIADGAVRLQDKAIHVDNNFLYRAARESATAIPDALKRFNLSPEVIAAKIIDAIPQTAAGAAIIASGHAEEPSVAPKPVSRPAAAPGNPPTSA